MAGVALATVVMLAGCSASPRGGNNAGRKPTTAVQSSGVPASAGAATTSADPDTPAQGKTLFADGSTIDPCSVIDVHELPASLHGVAKPADAFDSCPITVTVAGAGAVQMEVGPVDSEINDPLASTVTSLGHAITLERQTTPDAGHCRAYLDFADGYVLEVHATGAAAAGARVCSVMVPVATAVAARILSGGITHRTYPSGSVGSVDPCDVLTAAALAHTGLGSLLGTASSVEAHDCQWQFGTGNPPDTVELRFLLGPRPHADSIQQPTTIAGRPSVLSAYHNTDGTISCEADTGLLPRGGGTVEIAQVVATSTTVTRTCKAARSVATTAWPKLPHG